MDETKQANNNTKKHLSDSDISLTNPADVRQYGKFPQVRPR